MLNFDEMDEHNNIMSRREWLRRSAVAMATVAAASVTGCRSKDDATRRLSGNAVVPKALPHLASREVEALADSLPPLAISTMSMPKTGGKMSADCIKMVQKAADAGATLFDTAWAYCDGDGERMLGEALASRERDSYRLSTSMPTWSIAGVDDARTVLEAQLRLLRTDHIDYYSLQTIGNEDKYSEVYLQGGVLRHLLQMKAEGKIRHLGIDYIGEEDFLSDLLESDSFDFFRLPYNALDDIRMNGAQSSAIFAASDAGKGVFVTNPTKDGMLRSLNGDATDVLYGAFPDRSITSWALRAAANQDGVAAIIDSPADMQMLGEDIVAMSLGADFSDKETKVWQQALQSYLANQHIHCVDCKQCLPCPYGINIPENFMIHNALIDDDMLPNAYGDTTTDGFAVRAKEFSRRMKALDLRQSAFFCIGCGKCVPRCPQGIAIPQQMAHISLIIDKARESAAKRLCDR